MGVVKSTFVRKTAATVALISAGCAYRHGDLVRDRNWRIEILQPSGSEILGINVEERDGQIVVTGFGRYRTPQGRIIVEIASEDGDVLGRATATLLPPLAVPKRGYNYRFKAIIPSIPPAGSVIRVEYRQSGSCRVDYNDARDDIGSATIRNEGS